jgi:hypothetical protein
MHGRLWPNHISGRGLQMDQKHDAEFFTREEATDLLGKPVRKLTRERYAPRDPRLQPGAPGEVTRVEHYGDNAYGVGVAWGKPDQVRLLIEYGKHDFAKDVQLVRDRGVEHER